MNDTNKSKFYAVIMAGGTGTRLWPLSRKEKPKQLQSLTSEKAMIRKTYERLLDTFSAENIIISTVPEFVADIKKILPEILSENFIVEPALMGNAAACGLVTSILNKRNPNSVSFFVPSDHIIKDEKKFSQITEEAKKIIDENPKKIITIGIKPTKPDTGLGYIKKGEEIVSKLIVEAYRVEKFVEKPTLGIAKRYLESGEYFWNAGMFMWRNDFMLELFEKFLPETYKPLQKIVAAIGKDNEKEVLKNEYSKVEKTSIDFGIMEKTSSIIVIPADFGWNDIGSWQSLLEVLSSIHKKDVISKGNHISVDDKNCLVLGGDKLIATIGLSNIAIIDTPDAILICNSKQSQKVKDVLQMVEEKYL